MYIDKQALYESFLSRGFDDACARLMAGLDQTILEEEAPNRLEKTLDTIENKSKVAIGKIDKEINPIKMKIANGYEKLKNATNKYRKEVAENKVHKNPNSDSSNGNIDKKSDKLNTETREVTGTAGEKAQEGLNKPNNVEANNNSQNEGNVMDSVNLYEAIIELDEEVYKAKDPKEIAKHFNEYSDEEKRKIYDSLSENDQMTLDSILQQRNFESDTYTGTDDYKESNKEDKEDKKLANMVIKMKTMSRDEQNKIWNDMTPEQKNRFLEIKRKIDNGESDTESGTRNGSKGSAPNNAGPNTDNQSGPDKTKETDTSTTREQEETYTNGTGNAGESGNDNSKESENNGETVQAENVFPPPDYKIDDSGETVGNLVVEIKKNTLLLLQFAIKRARITSYYSWKKRLAELNNQKAPKDAIMAEEENFSGLPVREIYKAIFGDDGFGIKLDVFVEKAWASIKK